MGIGLEINKNNELDTSFILIHQTENNNQQSTLKLKETVNNLSKPLEVWVVNFNAEIELNNCQINTQQYPYIDGYGYQRYICK